MSVLFLIRKDNGNDQNESPTYMRITIAGQRIEVSTKRSVPPTNWSSETGRVKGITSSAKSVNNFLESLLSNFKSLQYQRQILNEGKDFYDDRI